MSRIFHDLTYKSCQEGKNYFSMLMDVALNLPLWEHQLMMTRSNRKREKLLNKIQKYTGSLLFFERQTNAKKRKWRRKKK